MRLKSLICFFFICTSTFGAEDLCQVYEQAVEKDPKIQAAFALLQANRQALPISISQMLPNLSANYTTTGNSTSTSFQNFLVFSGDYNTKNYGLTLSQPIFHPEMWAQLETARHGVKRAFAEYMSATQELIVRVAKQYFAILEAIDDLDFAKGQTKAFAREYEQFKQRFEVGLIAITDVETAKARYDNALATEISAKNEVANQYEKLREITGKSNDPIVLFPASKKLPLTSPIPENQETWVDTANQQNMSIIAATENALQYKTAIGTQVSGHFPKVDVTGQLQRIKQQPPFADPYISRSVTLNISIPIFSGFGVTFQTKEAMYRYDQAMQQLEEQRRSVDSATRQSFRGVLTAISRVNALQQAVISNQSSLKSTRAAYEVGTRTIVDVLNSESLLLEAERNHAEARYNYLVQGLLLKQAAGTLTPEDLYLVNQVIACNDIPLNDEVPPN